VLRRMFGLKRDEMMGGWRELHNEEFHDLYSFPSIISIIKSRILDGCGMCHEWGTRGTHIGCW
jgi:hypothetical protein